MKTYTEIVKEVRKEFEMVDSWNVGAETTDEKFTEREWTGEYNTDTDSYAAESIQIDKDSILSTPLITE